MKSVIVRYEVAADFAETNAANIRKVMAELRELGNDAIRYHAFRCEGGTKFVHFAMYRDEAAVAAMTELSSFAEFQQALRGSKPVSPPTPEWLDMVGASYDPF